MNNPAETVCHLLLIRIKKSGPLRGRVPCSKTRAVSRMQGNTRTSLHVRTLLHVRIFTLCFWSFAIYVHFSTRPEHSHQHVIPTRERSETRGTLHWPKPRLQRPGTPNRIDHMYIQSCNYLVKQSISNIVRTLRYLHYVPCGTSVEILEFILRITRDKRLARLLLSPQLCQ